MQSYQDHQLDTRVIDQLLASGDVDPEDFDVLLANLEDSADDAEPSNVHMIFSRLPGRRELEIEDDDGEDEAG